ncbi:hypothetical protein ACFL6C_07510 [Myxococcota bacterium]
MPSPINFENPRIRSMEKLQDLIYEINDNVRGDKEFKISPEFRDAWIEMRKEHEGETTITDKLREYIIEKANNDGIPFTEDRSRGPMVAGIIMPPPVEPNEKDQKLLDFNQHLLNKAKHIEAKLDEFIGTWGPDGPRPGMVAKLYNNDFAFDSTEGLAIVGAFKGIVSTIASIPDILKLRQHYIDGKPPADTDKLARDMLEAFNSKHNDIMPYYDPGMNPVTDETRFVPPWLMTRIIFAGGKDAQGRLGEADNFCNALKLSGHGSDVKKGVLQWMYNNAGSRFAPFHLTKGAAEVFNKYAWEELGLTKQDIDFRDVVVGPRPPDPGPVLMYGIMINDALKRLEAGEPGAATDVDILLNYAKNLEAEMTRDPTAGGANRPATATHHMMVAGAGSADLATVKGWVAGLSSGTPVPVDQ